MFTCFAFSHPTEDLPSSPSNPINVEDTDDEFIIKKPVNTNHLTEEFIDELYKHDEAKKPKEKRETKEAIDADAEKLTVESPKEFEIPVKPVLGQSENYDQFINHLYRHDELKKRSRRMIVFRHDC